MLLLDLVVENWELNREIRAKIYTAFYTLLYNIGTGGLAQSP
jgi:hypothetical protein